MTRRPISPTAEAIDALAVLGQQIRLGRRARGWTAAELGTRVGVSARTITAIEAGKPTASVGTVFSAATLVGFPLFGAEGPELARLRRLGQDHLALLPSRVRHPKEAGDEQDSAF
jgi:transcriptional regulator with XRE-family HTH domain